MVVALFLPAMSHSSPPWALYNTIKRALLDHASRLSGPASCYTQWVISCPKGPTDKTDNELTTGQDLLKLPLSTSLPAFALKKPWVSPS